MSVNANYFPPQPNVSTFIKGFHPGQTSNLFTTKQYVYNGKTEQIISPANSKIISNVFINGTLYAKDVVLNGSPTIVSDRILKDNIVEISTELSDSIMKLKPSQFTYKTDTTNHIHYGFIAQEVADELPNLVIKKMDSTRHDMLTVNYLEIIPLLVSKIQRMQHEIDELKLHIQK
jgi:hypothetical protein